MFESASARIEVDDERREHERHRRQHPSARVELAAGARSTPARNGSTKRPRFRANQVGSSSGKPAARRATWSATAAARREDERLEPAAGVARRLVVAAQHELLPEPAAVLARELPGQACRGRPSASRRRETPRRPSRPAASSSAIWSRRWASSSSTSRPLTPGASATYARHSAIWDSTLHVTPPSAASSSPPDVVQRARHGRPLPLLVRERGAPVLGDHVVPAAPPFRRRPPLRLHVPEPAEAMEQRVEHPVGPLELAARERAHPLEDRVAVALILGQDREHERGRRGRDEVLIDVHSLKCYT